MADVLFGNPGNADSGFPAVFPRAWANLADTFDRLVGAWPIKKMFQWIGDQRISNGNGEKSEDDPSLGLVFPPKKENQSDKKEDGEPEAAVGQEVEELVEERVIETAVDPAENPEVQRINLGDQATEDKLLKMVRQVAYLGLLLGWFNLGWAQDRKTLSTPASGDSEEVTPTPRQMQNFLWRTLVMKDLKLKGQVQSGEKKIPIIVRTKDRLLQFEFQDRPLQIRVRFAPEGSLIQRRKKSDSEWQVVTGAEKTESVAGTDLAYEDLGIDFLRWPDPQPKGEDSVMMLDCWVYEVNPPVESNYAKVRYWISKGYKTMIRADGLNAKGQPIKRFTFNSVIEAEDTVVIGEMKVAKLTPGTDLSVTRTYVQVDTVEKGSGL